MSASRAIVQTDIWSASGPNDPGEHVGRMYHNFGEQFVRFIASEFNKGNHLNMRMLTDEEAANVTRLVVN